MEKTTKSKRLHYVIVGLLIGFIISLTVILGKGLFIDQSKLPSNLIGKPAADFRAEWVQGREHIAHPTESTFTLEQLKGKPVILNFWASWCSSCRDEAHELEAFWQEHQGKIQVVGIAIQDTQEAAQAFARKFSKTYMIGLDFDGRISIDYGVTGVPETFLISADGVILAKETGPVTRYDLNKFIQKHLRDF